MFRELDADGGYGVYGVSGARVIHTFRMGSGAGIRISEPVYRELPSDRRGRWTKHQPPATYTLPTDAVRDRSGRFSSCVKVFGVPEPGVSRR